MTAVEQLDNFDRNWSFVMKSQHISSTCSMSLSCACEQWESSLLFELVSLLRTFARKFAADR